MTPVSLILRGDVAGLGKRGDVVEVTAGYARNFLVPRGLAMKATPGAQAQAEAMRRARGIKDAKDRESAEEIAKVLVSKVISISAKAGSGGKLFGSVNAHEIADAIQSQANVELDRRSVHIAEHIKTSGTHSVQIRIHGDVEFPLTIQVN